MELMSVTLLVSHPVRSSSKLARSSIRPLKSVTAVTSHVPTAAQYASAATVAFASHAVSAALNSVLLIGANKQALGDALGDTLGATLGDALGDVLGDELADALGETLGDALGDAVVGEVLGGALGDELGDVLGDALGGALGDALGDKDGESEAMRVPQS